ncbi:MAG TPA: FG-GAP repeat protein [Candidatus Sulfotelmatobacter sp.]|nr:FG-GAP repeat protein [Candidatus Sulfotelmatobacter sp.]
MQKTGPAVWVCFAVLLAMLIAPTGGHGERSVTTANASSLLPIQVEAGISAALGRALGVYRVRELAVGFEIENFRQGFTANFTSAGPEILRPGHNLRLKLRGLGRGSQRTTEGQRANHFPRNVAPVGRENRVEYRRGPVSEWYVNGPLGLEQGFTLTERPGGNASEPLVLTIAMSGNLSASMDGSGAGLILSTAGEPVFRYGALWARDASGKELPSQMEVQGTEFLLKVRDAGARYPIVIDPIVQVAKLTPSDGVHLGFFGVSVAISGNTIAVGMADTSLPGAVYIFEKAATGWSNMTQTAKLVASDGAANDYLGYSVSISGDTVVAGAPNSHGYLGAAYVFVKPASGWANGTETAELSGSGTYGLMGNSVGISGSTIIAGAPNNNGTAGSAFVFVEPASGWTNMTADAQLFPSDGQAYEAFGTCVGINGNTAVVGEPNGQGKVYVFVKPATGWKKMTQTARLIVSGGSAGGFSVAISGNTVVTGSPSATVGTNSEQGAAYVFVKPVNGWIDMNQTATLTASDGAAGDWFGYGVGISGNRIVAGAPFATIGSNTTQGAAYVYVRPTSGWQTTSHFNSKLIASDGAKNDQLGWSVSIDGSTVVAGAPASRLEKGSADVF